MKRRVKKGENVQQHGRSRVLIVTHFALTFTLTNKQNILIAEHKSQLQSTEKEMSTRNAIVTPA
jgi:hypothetical protein